MLTCLSMCLRLHEWISECVVLPQRPDSADCRFSAEHEVMPRLTPIPPTEAPEASLAGPTSAEETTVYDINSSD